jgi:hypothetical protein
LKKYKSAKREGRLYITENQLDDFLSHPNRRRYIKEVEFHIQIGFVKVKKHNIIIGGKKVVHISFPNNEIDYSEETIFVYQVSNLLKQLFDYTEKDMIQQAPADLKNIKRRVDFLLPNIKLCIEFDENEHTEIKRQESDKEREALLITHRYKIIRHQEFDNPVDFFNELNHAIVKRQQWCKAIKNGGNLTLEMRREILYEEYTSRGVMDKDTTKMMVQFVGLEQTVPLIPFDEARKMLNTEMSMNEFEETIDKHLGASKIDVNCLKRLISPCGFKMLGMIIKPNIREWYINMETFCEQIVIDMLTTQLKDTITIYDAIDETIHRTLINTESIANIARQKDGDMYGEKMKEMKKKQEQLERENSKLKKENLLHRNGQYIANELSQIAKTTLTHVDDLQFDHVLISGDTHELIYMDSGILTKQIAIDLYTHTFGTDHSEDDINDTLMFVTQTNPAKRWGKIYDNLEIRKKEIDVDDEYNDTYYKSYQKSNQKSNNKTGLNMDNSGPTDDEL